MATETFGARLKRLREAKGWSNGEMSRRAESFNSSYWEQGFAIDVNALRAFAEALGVTMDYLYTGKEPIPVVDPSTIPSTPGKRIRQRRDELGWSAHELADKSVSLDWVLSLEADADECVRCDKIAEALGVTPEWIMTGAEPKFPPKEPTDTDGNPLVEGEHYWIRSSPSDSWYVWHWRLGSKSHPENYEWRHIEHPERLGG